MGGLVARNAKPRTVKTKTVTTVDFEEKVSVSARTVDALIQPADPKQLQELNGIDFSLQYIMVHSVQEIEVGEFVEFDGKDFKVITRHPWDRYGFCKVIGEDTNEAQLEVTA